MSTDLTKYKWTWAQKFSFRVVAIYVLLFICSFSFPHTYIPDIGRFTHVFFEAMAKWFGNNILHIKKPYTVELISDSTGFYLNVLVLLFISIIMGTIWSMFDRGRSNYQKFYYWLLVFIRYYLAMQLLVYGWNKIFKWQFYLPEPNTLFTTLGNTPKDLLYWSTMGISRSYSICTGLLEVIAALLLFFRRTQLLGAFVAVGIMVNVLMINFSFDISVKLYSLFLLLLCFLVMLPYAKRTIQFFFPNNSNFSGVAIQYPTFKKQWLYKAVKATVIAIILFDSLAVYVISKNFNDDKAARPYLHGAFNVETFIKNGDTLLPITTDSYRWRRMFIHRQGYLITQMMNDEMKDYELENDSLRHELILKSPLDSSLHMLSYINMADSALQLNGKFYNDSLCIYLKKIDLSKLPLFRHHFNWTIDE